jgi:hypothetical protein
MEWGAVVRDMSVPADGKPQRVVLGFETLDHYLRHSPHFGAIAGRFANRIEGGRFTIGDMLRTFRDETFIVFLERFGWAGIHALTAWIITTPLLLAVLYYPLRPVLRRLARLRRSSTP